MTPLKIFIIGISIGVGTLGLPADNIETSDAETDDLVIDFLNKMANKSHVDERIRPHHNGPPVEVSCQVYIGSFGSISAINMDYSIDFFLRQEWTDPRLNYTAQDQRYITLTSKMIDEIWTPPLYFPNEKSGYIHKMTIPNRLARITPEGKVIYSMRLTLVLSCPMALEYFPLDTQECDLFIESYVYDSEDVILKWKTETPVERNPELSLPQFDLEEISEINTFNYLKTGNYSALKATFYLKREIGFYLLQTFVPSILIVILSWVAFWINKEAVPARIALGITTVLTMTTQLTGSRQGVPRVSYPKAMDVWMAACMLFVFLALVEYAIVNVMHTVEKDRGARQQDVEMAKKTKDRSSVLAYSRGRGCTAQYVDNCSRIVFPVFFLIFNVVYWAIYTKDFQSAINVALDKLKNIGKS